MDLLKWLQDFYANLFGSKKPAPAPAPIPPTPAPSPAPLPQTPAQLDRKVLVIDFNPVIPSQGGKRLSEVMGWNDTTNLVTQYIQDVHDCSYGLVNYTLNGHLRADYFPAKIDGFAYQPDDFIQHWGSGSGFHQPDTVDYPKILQDFDILRRITAGEIDEVWLFGFPYAGFYESCMGGAGAYFCNGPVIPGTSTCPRRFVIMGFNFERGVGEMHESLAHRAENSIGHAFQNIPEPDNLWQRFTRYDLIAPGASEAGSVHFAPNSLQDYDWGNPRKVLSRCDTWYNFPDLSGSPRQVDCTEWGNGDIRLHHTWWMRHFPHIGGQTNGVLNNWWEYIILT